jgi:hypothetical protein
VPAPVPAAAPRSRDRGWRRLSPRNLIAGGLALAVAVAAVFVLFGSTSNPTVDPIAQAATVSSSAPGFRMNFGFTISSPLLPAPIQASGNAVVDPHDNAASLSMAIDLSRMPQAVRALGSSTMQMQMIMDGKVIYVKLPQALLDKAPNLGGKPWVEMNLAKLSGVPGLSSFGSDPTTGNPGLMLQYLRAASDGVTTIGQQQVDGVQTTHYRAQLSLDRLGANVPSANRAAIQRALSQLQQVTQSRDLPIDIWVDANHLIRRMVMVIAVRLPNGPALTESVTADITDYGPQPRPTPPPADQVSDLSGLTAGATGGLSS